MQNETSAEVVPRRSGPLFPAGDELTMNEPQRWCQCDCGCRNHATQADEYGTPLCAECSTWTLDHTGGLICARRTEGFTRCHACHAPIVWGQLGSSRSEEGLYFRRGVCRCGQAWIRGRISFCPPEGD